MSNDGGPAFPAWDDNEALAGAGMTLRDYFAAKAMASILGVLTKGLRPADAAKVAEDAYFLADAMLKTRSV